MPTAPRLPGAEHPCRLCPLRLLTGLLLGTLLGGLGFFFTLAGAGNGPLLSTVIGVTILGIVGQTLPGRMRRPLDGREWRVVAVDDSRVGVRQVGRVSMSSVDLD